MQDKQLKLNIRKEPTADQKKQLFFNVLKDEFKNFKETGLVNQMRNWLYDELIKFDLEVDPDRKKIAWKHSIKEIQAVQKGLLKQHQYDNKTLTAKAIAVYKRKLIEQIFNKFAKYEQLLNLIENFKN
jgi:hypothetical protein